MGAVLSFVLLLLLTLFMWILLFKNLKVRVWNPQPTRSYNAARGHTTSCYFSTCGPWTIPQ